MNFGTTFQSCFISTVSEEKVFKKIIFYTQSFLDLLSNKDEIIYEKKTAFSWTVEMDAIA